MPTEEPFEIQLQAMLNLIPANAWYAAPSGALMFVNERSGDYGGLPKDHPLRSGEETGAAWDSHIPFLHPDDHDETRRVWSECLRSGSAGDVAFRVRDQKGEYRWFLSRAEPLRAADGSVRCWVGINFDIDDLMRAEFFLAEAQRLSHSGSWAFGPSGIVHWSAELSHIFGLETDRKPRSTEEYLELVHPEDRDAVACELQNLLESPRGFDLTTRIVRPDGTVRHVRCVGRAAPTSGASPMFLGTIIDVTEQEQLTIALRKREDALRKRENELRQVLDLTPQVVAVYGPGCERIYANRWALAYFGMTLEDWLKVPDAYEVHPDDPARLQAPLQAALANGTPFELETRLRAANGSYRWFLARGNPVRDDRGVVTNWYVASTDIEERKSAEDRLRQENVALREEVDKASMFEEIIGRSSALTAVLSRVAKVADSDSTVLITGETGTGKELIARAIHRRSGRSSSGFVTVNCAAIPRELIASELFGHEKGAFTGATQRRLGRFELAHGGSLFLDEVGELPSETQIALLRVLQEREFERLGGSHKVRADVRVIAATNRNLNLAIAEGRFREDLFYRLNVFPIEVPPLRQRPEDIPLLVRYLIARYARKAGKSIHWVNTQAMQRLQAYSWPGNVRELQNVIERSVIVCESDEFTVDKSWLSTRPVVDGPLRLPTALAAQERTSIEDALRATRGRVDGPAGAAARLGMPRSTLESRIRALKIDKTRFRG
ncbi:MAG: sigma 54-interacting transcriptional regulator [Polyangiaceae bacterium]